jgi:hypothetical protein
MLADNIDGGIYQECSIGFVYRLPECSVCGQDIRTCEHQVFSQYGKNDDEQRCHFLYRGIEKVLETSLVYRGANPDTGMSRELAERGLYDDKQQQTGNTKRLLIVPCYDAITVQVTKTETESSVLRADGAKFPARFTKQILNAFPENVGSITAQVVGYRGKERSSLAELERYVTEKSSPVTRVELKLLPDQEGNIRECAEEVSSSHSRIVVRPIRYRVIPQAELGTAYQSLQTKDGVRIWEWETYTPSQSGTIYCPEKKIQKQSTVVLTDAFSQKRYSVERFDERLWQLGRGFLADLISADRKITKQNRTLSEQPFRVRPVFLQGRRRFLIMKQSEQHKQVMR